MKDKRNCNNNMNYPMYGAPMMVPPMGFPNYPQMPSVPNFNQGITTNTFEQQINNLEQQINLLDQRITRLEKQYINNSNNNYNGSNYYMV